MWKVLRSVAENGVSESECAIERVQDYSALTSMSFPAVCSGKLMVLVTGYYSNYNNITTHSDIEQENKIQTSHVARLGQWSFLRHRH